MTTFFLASYRKVGTNGLKRQKVTIEKDKEVQVYLLKK